MKGRGGAVKGRGRALKGQGVAAKGSERDGSGSEGEVRYRELCIQQEKIRELLALIIYACCYVPLSRL